MVNANNKRGKQSEDNFFQISAAFQAEGLFPEWLFGFYRATLADDHEGIDAWAKTDIGLIPIQIKSSQGGMARHCHRSSRKHIPCVIASVDVLAQECFAKTLVVLEKERDEHMYKTLVLMAAE